MPVRFERTWIRGTGCFLPGEPVDNDALDTYIAPLGPASERLKTRILAQNGIRTRHYAIEPDGGVRYSCSQLAAEAVRRCLDDAGRRLSDVGMLACGTSGGDALMPGFAGMVLGELAGPPMQTLSSDGICASGVGALEAAAGAIELGNHTDAVVAGADLPSRLLRRDRYQAVPGRLGSDAHFLRWMLSDGAGALALSGQPPQGTGVRLRLRMIHQRSFSGDYPACMRLGLDPDRAGSHLDHGSWAEAEAAGALLLRQDISLLPHLFDIGIHEYVGLVHDGLLDPQRIDHFLCHYSSAHFAPVVDELMAKAGMAIPAERWYSNLATRGNTGAASIFVMLDELRVTRALRPGQRILCFVPESGRFTVAFVLIEVESAPPARVAAPQRASEPVRIAPPHDPDTASPPLRPLLGELAGIWHGYRSRAWRTPVVRRLRSGRFGVADHLRWMEQWIPQVREGSRWMREGAAALRPPFQELATLIEVHAGDEQDDYQILFEDYRIAGGAVTELDQLRRNPGGEALNSYLHALAATPNPVGLLGAMYLIEGTGQRIIPALLPLLRAALPLPVSAFRFLAYHGENDEHHLQRWLRAVEIVTEHDGPDGAGVRAIVETARRTAELYLMQLEHVIEEA